MNQKAFLTGSRIYGIHSDKSDIDLVVLVGQGDLLHILDATGADDDSDYAGDGERDSACLYFSKGDGCVSLNLIAVTDPDDFEIWRQGTKELKAQRPVTREQAVEHFQKLRRAKKMDDIKNEEIRNGKVKGIKG